MTRLWIVVGKRKKSTELKRSIQHLIPVECKESGKSDVMNCAVTTSPADRRTIGEGPSEYEECKRKNEKTGC